MRFQECLRGSTTICDGAWATEFQKLGAGLRDCVDEWNLTKPHFVEQVARSYVAAGSRVILTNTFRANPISLAPFGLLGKCDEINGAGVRISRKAVENTALVFASMGPSGKLLSTKEVTAEQLKNAFTQQAKALAAEGPDAIVIETLSDLAEARIAAAAALETGLPVIVSFFLDPRRDRGRAIAAITMEQVAATMTGDGVHGIGANCGFRVRDFIAVCRRFAAASSLPIWIKPSAGLPEIVEGVAKYKRTAAEFIEPVPELLEAGATFLGGCCGTTPEFLQQMALAARTAKAAGNAAPS